MSDTIQFKWFAEDLAAWAAQSAQIEEAQLPPNEIVRSAALDLNARYGWHVFPARFWGSIH
jgi:hypothetical protein